MAWRYPWVLGFFLLWGGLVLLWYFNKHRRSSFYHSMPGPLAENLFNRIRWTRTVLRQRLRMAGVAFLILSASGPQIGTRVKPVERKGVDLVFAVDVSVSMDAIDVKPSRLEKAKYEIGQLVKKLKGDRVGIVVFAGSSHLYLPLTTDYEAALLFLNTIDTKMIPTQGTSLHSALSTALSVFTEENEKHKVVILVTDGEDHEGDAVAIANKAMKTGLVIHTIGVGTHAGSLIPIKTGDDVSKYKRDKQGNLVTSVLNESALSDVARAGNGIFIRFDNRAASYVTLLDAINAMEKKTISTHEFSEYEDRYQILALLSLLCFVIGFIIPTRDKRQHETWRGRFV